jgi:hypothetical protein
MKEVEERNIFVRKASQRTEGKRGRRSFSDEKTDDDVGETATEPEDSEDENAVKDDGEVDCDRGLDALCDGDAGKGGGGGHDDGDEGAVGEDPGEEEPGSEGFVVVW